MSRPWTAAEDARLAAALAEGLPHKVIAAEVGRSVSAVRQRGAGQRRAGRLLGIAARARWRQFEPAEDAALIAGRQAGKSYAEIGREIGRSADAVEGRMQRLRAMRHPLVPPGPAPSSRPRGVCWDLLPQLWTRPGISMTDIARAVGVTRQAVQSAARTRGLPPRDDIYASRRRIDPERFRALWDFGVSSDEIARAFGVKRFSIIKARALLGLQPRTRPGRATLAQFREWQLGQRMKEAA